MDLYYEETKILTTDRFTSKYLSHWIEQLNHLDIDFNELFEYKSSVAQIRENVDDFEHERNIILPLFPNLTFKLTHKNLYFYDIYVQGTLKDIYTFLDFTMFSSYYQDLTSVLCEDGTFCYDFIRGRGGSTSTLDSNLILKYLKEQNRDANEHKVWERLMGIDINRVTELFDIASKRLYGIPLSKLTQFRVRDESSEMDLSLCSIDDKLLDKVITHIGEI